MDDIIAAANNGLDKPSKQKSDNTSNVDMINSNIKNCQVCGAELRENSKFCERCGSPVTDNTKDIPVDKPEEKFCPNCGCIFVPGNKFCDRCGTPDDKAVTKSELDAIKASRTSVVCRNCGSYVKEGFMFCTKCGASVDSPVIPDKKINNSGRRCPQCGALMEEGNSFCCQCGYNMNSLDETVGLSAEPNIDYDNTVKNVCPNCGVPVVEGNMFCESCGCRLQNNGDSFSKTEPQYVFADPGTADFKVCPNCGNRNPKDNIFCESCGFNIEGRSNPVYDNNDTGTVSLCPDCGAPVAENSSFCEVCGCRLNGNFPGNAKNKKSKKGLIITLSIIAVLIIGAVAAFFIIHPVKECAICGSTEFSLSMENDDFLCSECDEIVDGDDEEAKDKLLEEHNDAERFLKDSKEVKNQSESDSESK